MTAFNPEKPSPFSLRLTFEERARLEPVLIESVFEGLLPTFHCSRHE